MVIFEAWDFSVIIIIIITDCWLWQTFHDYEGPVHRYLKLCRNVGVVEHWSQWLMKIIEIWVWTKHLAFSSIYNSPIHRNLQKTPLSVQVVWLPPHMWSSMVHVQVVWLLPHRCSSMVHDQVVWLPLHWWSSMVHNQTFCITSIELATPIHYLDTRAGKLWRLRQGISHQYIYNNTVINNMENPPCTSTIIHQNKWDFSTKIKKKEKDLIIYFK